MRIHEIIAFSETQHTWHDGGRERDTTSSGNGQPVASGEEISSCCGARRRGFCQEVSLRCGEKFVVSTNEVFRNVKKINVGNARRNF